MPISTAIFFLAHAAVRIVTGSIPQFDSFMTWPISPVGEAVVWVITLYEIIAGTLLIINRHIRNAAAKLIMMAAVGILHISGHLDRIVG